MRTFNEHMLIESVHFNQNISVDYFVFSGKINEAIQKYIIKYLINKKNNLKNLKIQNVYLIQLFQKRQYTRHIK